MKNMRFFTILVIPFFLFGCATTGLWGTKSIEEINIDEINSKTTSVRSDGVYVAIDQNRLCIPYQVETSGKIEAGSLMVTFGKGYNMQALEAFLQDKDGLQVESISGEYRLHTRLPVTEIDHDFRVQAFTFEMSLPVISEGDRVIDGEKDFSYLDHLPQESQPRVYMERFGVYPPWQGTRINGASNKVFQYILAQKIAGAKDDLDDIKLSTWHDVAWFDQGLNVLIDPAKQISPVERKGEALNTTTQTSSTDVRGLLIRADGRYYLYQSRFYAKLKKFGAFEGSDSRGYVRIVSFDREKNRAGIGFRLYSPRESTNIKIQQNDKCQPDKWKLLVDGKTYPYAISFVESEEKVVHRYPMIMRVALTPLSVAYDVVTAPLYGLLYFVIILFPPS